MAECEVIMLAEDVRIVIRSLSSRTRWNARIELFDGVWITMQSCFGYSRQESLSHLDDTNPDNLRADYHAEMRFDY